MSKPFSVSPFSFADQMMFRGRPFPLALQCDSDNAELSDAIAWLSDNAADLDRKAGEHGAILFRGFPLTTADDFDACIAAFGYRNFPYRESLSNAVRRNRTERVFTANEAPPEVTILLHHEMAQTQIFPGRLLFFCEQPAETGGATPVCRSDELFARLQAVCPEFARDCETKGLRYTNVMPADDDPQSGMGRSWRSTLRAESPAEAESRLLHLGYDWEWQPDGSLRATTPVLPAVRELGGGRKSFFNQLIAAFLGWKDTRNDPSNAIRFGDDSALDRAAVETAAKLAEEYTVDIPWQRGDFALLDNFVVMHGRRTFTGKRTVLASLIAAE